jgi:hypothetical protein
VIITSSKVILLAWLAANFASDSASSWKRTGLNTIAKLQYSLSVTHNRNNTVGFHSLFWRHLIKLVLFATLVAHLQYALYGLAFVCRERTNHATLKSSFKTKLKHFCTNETTIAYPTHWLARVDQWYDRELAAVRNHSDRKGLVDRTYATDNADGR